jgi:hypothetical protein
MIDEGVCIMSKDIEKKVPAQAGIVDKSKSKLMTSAAPLIDDGFAGWDDRFEGDDQRENAGIIQGTLVKFSNDGKWVDRNGDEIPGDLEVCVAEVVRLVQKWIDQKPVETIILEPHQKFPDIEELNEKAPREEWREYQGKLQGPWQAQHLLRWVNLETMDKYTYPTATIGGTIAIRDLRDRILLIRRLKGGDVYAVVTLGRVWWNTSRGGRWRPQFIVKRWVRLGAGGGEQVEVPPTSAAIPVQQVAPQSDLPLVPEPTLQEEMNDEIPDFSKPTTPPPPPPPPPPRKPQPARPAAKSASADRRKLEKRPQKSGKPVNKKQTILDAG